MAPPSPVAPRWHRQLPWWCGLVAFALAAKNLIGTYADLGIYLDVAREFRTGGIDLFRDRDPAGPWLYPHAAALPFMLLQMLLSDSGARWAWCGLLGLGTALLLRDTARAAAAAGGLRWWQWLVFGCLFQRCIAQNLTHGQLSLWVGTCVAAGIVHLQRQNDRAAGIWLGTAAALKLTPLLFLPALLLMRRPRAALWLGGGVAALVLLLPWPFCGTAEHLRHLADFWRTVTESLTAPEQAAIVRFHAGPSVSGTLDYLLQAQPVDRGGHLVHVVDLSPGVLTAVEIGWSLVLAAVHAVLFWRARRHDEPTRIALQASAVLLATVFFTPLVRVYHLAAALLPFALFCRGPRGARDGLWWATAAALAFAMTLRQKKLLGETLWRAFDVGGLLHFALVAMLVWLVHRSAAPSQAEP